MGYEELNKLFMTLESNDRQFVTYSDVLKKIAADSNAAAQETGLNCIISFISNSSIAVRFCVLN